MRNTIIILDPGHGGNDPGATWKQADKSVIKERDKNLAIANYAWAYLESMGMDCAMTRVSNRQSISISKRISIASLYKKGSCLDIVFVSIHCNAPADRSPKNLLANGTEILIPSDSSDLADAIWDQWVESIPEMKWRGLVVRKTGRGSKLLTEIHAMGIPCCLVECGFITNKHDRGLICNPDYQYKMGRAIADGIIDYIKMGGAK